MTGTIDYGHGMLPEFHLDPAALHLNHGSYGAVPRKVMAALHLQQIAAERRCTTFFRETYFELLADRLSQVATRYGGAAEDWVFTENATAACNAVLASERLAEGDEILFTSAIYGAVRKALIHWQASGVTLTELPLPLPVEDPAQVTALVAAALSARSKLLVIDHIASASALKLPVAEIAALCRANGTRVLIDGAHAPGHIPLDVPALGADYYTGNAHKWQFAPKGCAVLWVRPGLGDHVHPNVISHGYGAGLRAEFGWIGTRDSSAWFTFDTACAIHDAWGGPALMRRNAALAAEAAGLLADEIGGTLAGPAEMQAAMVTIRLPVTARAENARRVQQHFAHRYGIETTFVPWNDALGVRISAQVYNALSDYRLLAVALKDYFGL